MTRPSGEGSGEVPAARVGVGLLGSLALMVVYLIVRRDTGEVLDAIGAIVVGGAVVGICLWVGLGAAELGVAVADLRSGAVWGGVLSLAAMVVIVSASWLPVAEDFFEDDRYADLSGSELAWEALVRVPIATSLFEEVLFRGALLGLLLAITGRWVAIGVSSVLFGLWHVLAASDFADANDGLGSSGALAVIVLTVVVTGTAGAGLAWLRLRSRSVLAPALVHATVNSTALVVTALVS